MIDQERDSWARQLFSLRGLLVLAVSALVGWGGVVLYKSWGVWSDALTEDSAPPVVADAEACACGSNSLCTGPRGGRFCVDSSGNKRYRTKD